jgi:Uma2 family endonuclease
MPTYPRHTKVSRRIIERVCPLFIGTGWVIGVQQPITIGGSEPEPDFYAASGPADRYDDRQPGAKDVALVIEAADTSLGFDQTTKLEMYAAAKIAVYWIVNLKDRRVEVYTQPRGGKNPTYRQQTNYGPDDAVPVVVAGKEVGRIPVKELLP